MVQDTAHYKRREPTLEDSLISILSHLELLKHCTDHKLIEDMVRQGQAKKRKGVNQENRSVATIDTAEKVEELINTALLENMIAVVEISDDGRILELTPEGKLTLAIYWTHNFSAPYKSFSSDFEAMMEKNKQLLIPKLQMMRHFHIGRNIGELQDQYTTLSQTQQMRYDFHQHIIQDIAGLHALVSDDYLFHFTPTLFVPPEFYGKKVTLEIEGLSEVPDLLVTSPYINKRYYVAGLRNGRMNTAHGFYPILAKRQVFPTHKKITLHWEIDNEIKVDHVLEIDFSFSNPHGQLFSTEQRFSRQIAGVPNFSIVTALDKNKNYATQSRLIVHDIFNHFEIQENVTLTNFPMELHFYTTAKYFHKWYHQLHGGDQE